METMKAAKSFRPYAVMIIPHMIFTKCNTFSERCLRKAEIIIVSAVNHRKEALIVPVINGMTPSSGREAWNAPSIIVPSMIA